MRATGIVRAEPGANLHREPKGEIIKGLINGTEVEIFDTRPITLHGFDWLRVREQRGEICGPWGYIGARYVEVRAPQPDASEPIPLPSRREAPPEQKPVPWWLLAVLAGAGIIALAFWL